MKSCLNNTLNRWKPQRQRDKNDVSLMTVTNKVRQLLNKVTQQTLDQIVQELLTYDFNSNEDNLKQVAKLFLEKCINEPEYCALYTKVIKKFFQHNGIIGAKIKFLILSEAQELFNEDINPDNHQCVDPNQNGPVGLEENPKDVLLADEQDRLRRRSLGLYVFLANLFLIEFLSRKIVESVFVGVLGTMENKNIYDEKHWILTGFQVLKTLGKESYYWMRLLPLEMALEKHKMKMKLKRNFRLQFAIDDALDLMKRDFAPRDSAIIV
ncbi:hypothetical protein GCK72_004643 [Caenorhabditis remanei]|uniref:MIF4G domain-containing protein n=1 Tax=Caenorhabditis remanei TaxID=31234 RepID=A0A6A5HE82_CAERE|nr:hypothetical protein GCK72_004643 [Caenorhabditis remanei]KAF1764693.1 hypothetical protein GCK72_004643 [Caenorhabditis remanei]